MPKNFAHLGGLSAYEILGVDQTATAEQIEAAYRSAIKRQHSDTGGVTRLAQLVNDARDALVNDRASYDAWLKNQASQRPAEAARDPDPAASASDWSRFTWADADDLPPDDPWDPWENIDYQASPQPRQGAQNQPAGTTSDDPDHRRVPLSAEERRRAYLAVIASLLLGPLGLWLGIRSYRRATSAAAVVAIVIGGMSVLFIVSLVIAISLGVFSRESSNTSASAPWVRTSYVETTKGLITVVDRSGRSATLKIITWND